MVRGLRAAAGGRASRRVRARAHGRARDALADPARRARRRRVAPSLAGPRRSAGRVARGPARPASRLARLGRAALAASIARPGGCSPRRSSSRSPAGSPGTRTELDLRHPPARCPRDLPELQDVDELEEATGRLGRRLRDRRRADDLTDPAVIAWMSELRAAHPRPPRVRAASSTPASDEDVELCPAIALADPVRAAGATRARSRSSELLDLLPPLLLAGGRRPRRETGDARRHGADRLRHPGDAVRRAEGADRRRSAPSSTRPGRSPTRRRASSAEVVGLPVLAADANAALDRQPLPAHRSPGSLAVALVLLAVYRSLRAGAGAADPDRRSPPAGRRSCSRPPASRSTRCRRPWGRW